VKGDGEAAAAVVSFVAAAAVVVSFVAVLMRRCRFPFRLPRFFR
jgi:hypothetical protein